MVKDIFPGNLNSSPAYLTNVNGRLVFAANDGVNGEEIWTSDGTAVGTNLLQNISTDGGSAPQNFYYNGTQVFASIIDNTYGRELWMAPTSFVLPLSQLSFTAKLQQNNSLLNWNTLNEEDIQSYGIERSSNGSTFTPVGRVTAAGNGNNNYSFTDAAVTNLKVPVVYYRLKINEVNGNHTYSKIVEVKITKKASASVYPNPATHTINVQLSMPLSTVTIQDATGKTVSTVAVSDGRLSTSVNISALAGGLYFIKTGNETIPFVKQ
jgi:ELWxxDGT repeat protein